MEQMLSIFTVLERLFQRVGAEYEKASWPLDRLCTEGKHSEQGQTSGVLCAGLTSSQPRSDQ